LANISTLQPTAETVSLEAKHPSYTQMISIYSF